MTDSAVDLSGIRLTDQLRTTLLMLDIWNAVQDTGKWRVPTDMVGDWDRERRLRGLSRRASVAARKLGLVYRDGVVTVE